MTKGDKKRDEVLDELVGLFEEQQLSLEDIRERCDQYPEFADDIMGMWQIWQEMDQLKKPQIHIARTDRFRQTLRQFRKEQAPDYVPPKGYVHVNSVLKWAAIFVAGFGLGMLINSGYFRTSTEGTAPVRGFDVRSLTSGESASDRLIAVQNVKEMVNPEDAVLEALFTTMTQDPNVNVRLSSIEAMLQFVEQPKARELLIKSFRYQDSPIVQITLAEVMIQLQREGQVDNIGDLIDAEGLDLEVKMYLEESLNL